MGSSLHKIFTHRQFEFPTQRFLLIDSSLRRIVRGTFMKKNAHHEYFKRQLLTITSTTRNY